MMKKIILIVACSFGFCSTNTYALTDKQKEAILMGISGIALIKIGATGFAGYVSDGDSLSTKKTKKNVKRHRNGKVASYEYKEETNWKPVYMAISFAELLLGGWLGVKAANILRDEASKK